MKTVRTLVTFAATLALAGCSHLENIFKGAAEGALAGPRAELRDAQGRDVGTVTFEQTPNGLLVRGDFRNLPPGTHALHIHTTGACVAPEFTSAGGHFNPFNRQHGMRNQNGPHAGDLPNVEIGTDGTGHAEVLATYASLNEGPGNILDSDGSAVVVHASADDHRSDPAGNAGARIACGVVGR